MTNNPTQDEPVEGLADAYDHMTTQTFKDTLAARDAIIAQQAEEVARLESQVYVPGFWRCAECGYILILSNREKAEGDKCPNDGSPLWRVSYEQEVARLKAAIKRRDRNENRNCINWGLCSQHDRRMSDGCNEQPVAVRRKG